MGRSVGRLRISPSRDPCPPSLAPSCAGSRSAPCWVSCFAVARYEVQAAAVQVYNEEVDDLLHLGHHNGGGQNLPVALYADQQGGILHAQ